MDRPVHIVSSMATQRLLAELVALFEAQSPTKVTLTSIGGVDAAKRVRAGEAFDVIVLASDVIDALIAEGHALPGSRRDIASSSVGVAVRAGAPRPDISSADALKRAILAAPTVGYSTGPSGNQLAKMFADWGIKDALEGRIVVAPPGVPVGSLVARGDVALGFQQMSELIFLDGIDVVGLMPPDAQISTIFSGGITQTSGDTDAARQVLEFMANPAVDEVRQRNGVSTPR